MLWLIVGLGNPGPEYRQTRHNIGFMVSDLLVERWGGRVTDFRSKWSSEIAQLERGRDKLLIQKPMQYMNLSGGPVQRAMAFFQIEPGQVLVVHDDIDLDFGRIKLKQGGGHGGHNGLRSISSNIGEDYLRVRAGIGRPNHPRQSGSGTGSCSDFGTGRGKDERVVSHVLDPFSKAEQRELPLFLAELAAAVDDIVQDGIGSAMNRHNLRATNKTNEPL